MASQQGTSDVVLDESGGEFVTLLLLLLLLHYLAPTLKSYGEFVNWKKKYLKMRQKYKDLGVSSDDESSNDDDDQHPANKQSNGDESMDPLVKLGPDCFVEVLNWLSPKELLDCKLVSKSWKSFIESSTGVVKHVVKRAMNKIVVKLFADKFEGMNTESFTKILAHKNKFKHMKTDFQFVHKTIKRPFIDNAMSLESLELLCTRTRATETPLASVNFPSLKKFIMGCHSWRCHHRPIIKMIYASSFPEVTHLKIGHFDDSLSNFFTALKKFPKLKVLALGFHPYENWNQVGVVTLPDLPQIKKLRLHRYSQNILDQFKAKLTEVYIDEIKPDQLATILENLKGLKSLAFNNLTRVRALHQLQLPRHDNLQTLRIESFSDILAYCDLFRATPSLEVLITHSNIDDRLIEFIATEMRNLKELICKSVARLTDGKLLNEKDPQYVNTSFQLTIDPSLEYFDSQFYEDEFN